MTNLVSVIAGLAGLHCQGDLPIETRVWRALIAAFDTGLTTDREAILNAALAAAIGEARKAGDLDGGDRVLAEITAIRTLNAAIDGLPIDWTRVEVPEAKDFAGVVRMFQEICRAYDAGEWPPPEAPPASFVDAMGTAKARSRGTFTSRPAGEQAERPPAGA